MGIEQGTPIVQAKPSIGEMPVYNLNEQVVTRTAHANVSCVARHPLTPSWYRQPMRREDNGGLRTPLFVSTNDAEQLGTDPWLIPVCRTFSETTFVLADFGVAQGWRVDRHPRFVADLTGDGRGDLIGFGDAGVYVALNNGGGGFPGVQFAVADLGYDQGWRIESHIRYVVDLTRDGRADVIGFGQDGVWVALNRGDGSFDPARFVLADFAPNAFGWQVDRNPRFVADLTGDGRGDIVGFGDDAVWVALSRGDGSFGPSQLAVEGFGYNTGWRVDQHPRFVADLTGDGRGDIVGCGDDGVWVALNRGDGSFGPAQFVLADFGVNQTWSVAHHPRFVADLTGDGRADIIGFGDAGVKVAYNNGDGTFGAPQTLVAWFGEATVFQSWTVDRTPRLMVDITGDHRADVVGFGNDGVWVAVNDPQGPVAPQLVALDFGYDQGGWRVEDHPRLAADLTGEGGAELIGFGDAGVYVAYNQGIGPVPVPVVVV